MRERPPGFAEGTSLCLRRTGPHPAGHPSDLSVVRSPCSRGPSARILRAHAGEARGLISLRARPWMADVEVRLFAPLHDAEHRSAKREQGAHVRAQGCASSRRPAWREKRRAVSPTRSRRNRRAGRLALVTFPERKVTRSPLRRAKPSRKRCDLATDENGFRLSPG